MKPKKIKQPVKVGIRKKTQAQKKTAKKKLTPTQVKETFYIQTSTYSELENFADYQNNELTTDQIFLQIEKGDTENFDNDDLTWQNDFPDDEDIDYDTTDTESENLNKLLFNQSDFVIDIKDSPCEMIFYLVESNSKEVIEYEINNPNTLGLIGESSNDYKKRNYALSKIAEYLIEEQFDFLNSDTGDPSLLKIIYQKEIANRFMIGETGISRLKNVVHVRTPHGLKFPLSAFFSKTSKKTRLPLNEDAIKQIIVETVISEEVDDPLTPSAIAMSFPEPSEFNSDNYRPLRRRLNEYGIPSKSDRKKIYAIGEKTFKELPDINQDVFIKMAFPKIIDSSIKIKGKHFNFIKQRLKYVWQHLVGGEYER